MFCLAAPSDRAWAELAARDLAAVLVDHAHCEMKAATNAMSLAVRHPQNLQTVRALADIAREELEHFTRVVEFLEARGLELGAPPVNAYAAALRSVTQKLPRSELPQVVDRLLVGALIEARSCERFKLLLEVMPKDTEAELCAFYQELFTCEARHYRQYVDLAVGAASGDRAAVEARLDMLASLEAEIIGVLPNCEQRATVHG